MLAKDEKVRSTGRLLAADAGGDEDLILTFKINDVNTVLATNNVDIVPDDVSNKDLDSLLAELASKFKSVAGIDQATVTGNGIYLENSEPFSISTSEIAVADVMNSQKLTMMLYLLLGSIQ